MATPSPIDPFLACVEHGVWTPIPAPALGGSLTLSLKDIDAKEDERCASAGILTFHLTGCSGDFSDHQPQAQAAAALAAQVHDPGAAGVPHSPATKASFLYHLGDVAYVDDDKSDPDGDDQTQMYNAQFYAPYTGYGRAIVAIAGNHDGKDAKHGHTSVIDHFLENFCAKDGKPAKDNHTDKRPAITQPYVYWRLDTPLAYIIGLYTNIANGGILDDPAKPDQRPQYDWLVAQLADVKQKNTTN